MELVIEVFSNLTKEDAQTQIDIHELKIKKLRTLGSQYEKRIDDLDAKNEETTELKTKYTENMREYRTRTDTVLAYKRFMELCSFLPQYFDYLQKNHLQIDVDMKDNAAQYSCIHGMPEMKRVHGHVDMKTIFDRFKIPGIIHLFSTNEGVGTFELLIRICNMYHQRKLLQRNPFLFSRVFAKWNNEPCFVRSFTQSVIFSPEFITRTSPWTL